MKLRWAIFAGAAIAAALLIAFVMPKLGSTAAVASGPLTLPDGSVVRVVGSSYGTHHLWGSPVAMTVQRLPAPLRSMLQRVLSPNQTKLHAMTTSDPSLVVWVDRSLTNLPSAQLRHVPTSLANSAGAIAGKDVDPPFTGINGVVFPVFPRRDPMLGLVFMNAYGGTGPSRLGALSFPNPMRGNHPQWQPQPLPATNTAGDVQVVLESLFTGVNPHHLGTYGSRRGSFRVKLEAATDAGGAFMALRVFSLTDSNELWAPASVLLSDATGNRIKNSGMSTSRHDPLRKGGLTLMTFSPVLWPDEAAWKVDLEIKRENGFPAGELITFRNVPLGMLNQTNPVGWQTNLGGVTVTLEHVVRNPPQPKNAFSSRVPSEARFTFAGVTNGIHVDLISARLDDGTDLKTGSWWSHDQISRTHHFENFTTNAVTADFTIAVHRSRRVEFLVKPELGPVDIELPTGP